MRIETGRKSYQTRVGEWMRACFPPEAERDASERTHRFLEEALELAQACGCTKEDAHRLADYVFDRPAGDPAQEAGGAFLTLNALCTALKLDAVDAGETELARVHRKIEAIRAKRAARPEGSPLPQ